MRTPSAVAGKALRRGASMPRARNKDELSARAKAGAEKAILQHFRAAGEAESVP